MKTATFLGTVATVVGVVVVSTTLASLFVYPVMLLWNWLVPSIFHLRTLSFFETWGMIWLSSILFKGVPNPFKIGSKS